jgi:GMP synthase (glutamine-hydrolysing)
LIFSGGPSSVYDEQAPRSEKDLISKIGCPVLGICYGLQLMAYELGGKVQPAKSREYGYGRLKVVNGNSQLFAGLPKEMDVWLSHGDHVTELPGGFSMTAETDDAVNAFENPDRQIYGVQFHPEVAHTPLGGQILRNFLFEICRCRGDWSPAAAIEEQVARIRETVGDHERVICGLSGGVDSSVVGALLHRAIGDRQTCIFIDNGLLREGEFETALMLLRQTVELNIVGVDASQRFLGALSGVVDPERKRKIIGAEFIDVFEAEANRIGDVNTVQEHSTRT